MKRSRKLSFFLIWAVTVSVHAEVVTDGSTGAIQSLSGQMTIPQSLGTTIGNNLFHSFQTFNINIGESATFTGSDTLQNVISRVTGGEVSTLNGLLQSHINHANFYFINPAGIVLGANAYVNVPASFHLSTANVLHFANGDSFYSSLAPTSAFSMAEPASFGFLGDQSGDIQIIGSQLRFKENSSVSFSSGNITMTAGNLFDERYHPQLTSYCEDGFCLTILKAPLAKGINTQLSAVGNSAVEISLTHPVSQSLSGQLKITDSSLNVSGDGAGYLQLSADTLDITNSSLINNNTDINDAGSDKGIYIRANTLTIENSQMIARAEGIGSGTNINILTTGETSILGSTIHMDSQNARSGSVSVNAKDIQINASTIESLSGVDSGNISIHATGNLAVINASKINTDTGSVDTRMNGAAGNVSLQANNIVIAEDTRISSTTSIDPGFHSRGSSGSIEITALNNLSLTNNVELDVSGYEPGLLQLQAKGMTLSNASLSAQNILSADSFNNPKVQGIYMMADTLDINQSVINSKVSGTEQTGSTLKINTTGALNIAESSLAVSGDSHASSLEVRTGNMSLSNSILSANSTLDLNDNQNARGIYIASDDLSLDNSSIQATGQGATVNVATRGALTLNNGSQISTDIPAHAHTNGGGVTVESLGAIKIYNDSRISTETYGASNAGWLNVESKGALELYNLGRITSSTLGLGNAGDVRVTADSIIIDNHPMKISPAVVLSVPQESSHSTTKSFSSNIRKVEVTPASVPVATVNPDTNGVVSPPITRTDFDDGVVQTVITETAPDGNIYETTSITTADNVLLATYISVTYADGSGGASVILMGSENHPKYDPRESENYPTSRFIAANVSSPVASISSIAGILSRGKAGSIEMIANKTINLRNGGLMGSLALNAADAGNISLKANDVLLDSALISSDAQQGGNAGNVMIDSQTLTLQNKAQINSLSKYTGNAGNIFLIAADAIKLTNSDIDTSAALGSGNAGSIFVTSDTLLLNQANLESSNVNGAGNEINLDVKHLSLINGGTISTTTQGIGNAGKITINHAEDVLIQGLDPTRSFLNTNNVQVKGIFSGIYLNSQGSSGKGGDLELNTRNLTLTDGGEISAITVGDGAIAGDSDSGATVAGNININAENIILDGGGLIVNSTASAGNAGTININASKSLTISGAFDNKLHSGITNLREFDHSAILSNATYALNSDAASLGSSGKISIITPELQLLNGGLISTATEGQQAAGNINIQTNNLELNNGATISSASVGIHSSGKTGDIDITAAQNVGLAKQSKITIQNDAMVAATTSIKPGVINVSAFDINLKDSSITAQSNGNVDAGRIQINFAHQLYMDPSFITTSANLGNGGNITVYGNGLINLQNSGFFTSVTGATGNGGNINVSANSLIMDNGAIQANAVTGSGGNINLNLKALISSQNQLIKGGAQVLWQPFVSGFNVIQAASTNGINGAVNISSPQFNISGSIIGLDSSKLALPIIDHNLCQNSTIPASSLVNMGKGGIPDDGLLFSFVPALSTQKVLQQVQDIITIYSSNIKDKSLPCAALKI